MKKLNIGVIGLHGHAVYGTALMEHPATNVKALCDWDKKTPHTSMLKEFAGQYNCRFHKSIDTMVDNESLDAISILAPPAIIPDIVAQVAGKTKAVLLEKPVARNIKGAKKIYRYSKKKNLRVSIAYPTRNFIQLECLHQAVKDGKIGKPLAGTYTYLQTNGPRYNVKTSRKNLELIAGGDDTMFIGYAALDLAWIAGSRIDTVHANGGAFFYPKYRKAGINDLTHLTFTMSNGFIGSITVGRTTVKNHNLHSVDITGDKGCVSAYFGKDRVGAFLPDGRHYYGIPIDFASRLVDDFVQTSLQERDAQYTVEDAFYTAAVQEAMKRSVKTGKVEKVAQIPIL